MLVIYFFYKIYVSSIAAAFTQEIVSDKYKDLDVSVPMDDDKEDLGSDQDRVKLLSEEDHEGGEEDRPQSKEVHLVDIEWRNNEQSMMETTRGLLPDKVEEEPDNKSNKSHEYEIDSDFAFEKQYGDVDILES